MSLVLSGYYNWEEGTILSQDGYGYFWATSSSTSSASSRFLFVGANYLNPQNGAHKELGFTLRCKNSGLFPTGSSAARSYPVSLVYSGYYFWGEGYLWNQGSASLYWLSQATEPNNVEYAYYLRITDIDMNPRSTIGKTLGLALRLRLHFRA